MIKLAVVSDIHIGLAARSKDLCPQPPVNSRNDRRKYDAKTDACFRQRFVDFIHEKGITADYLVLPGDLTNTAQPQEVQIASEFVLQTADALQVRHDKIVFTAGNHDLDWSVIDPKDTTGLRLGQRYDPMRFKAFHFGTLVEQGAGDLFSPPHFTIWTFDDLLVVAYNSASHDVPSAKHHIHHGLADPAHLAELRRHLDAVVGPDARLRLFLVHHHPINFTNPLPVTPDFSLMTNAESLLDILHEQGFDLLIHGHKHHPRFDTHSTQTYPHLPILCSGSLSVEIDTQWAGTVDNQFHVVTVNGRAGSDNLITGTITSWTHNHCRGWIPSQESTSGIHHIIPFGSYVMPRELDARLEPYIIAWLQTHDCILWEQILKDFPDLEHLPINSAIAAFKRLAEKLGKRSMYETLKDLILYNGDTGYGRTVIT